MNERKLASSVAPRSWAASSFVLGAGFFLTGTGTITLGVLLPLLSQRWGLHDDKAGFLLFAQFMGSTLGAVLTGINRIRSLMIGYGLLVLSAGALAFSGPYTLFLNFFFFGVGLGMVMTATSLLFSDRYGDERATQLERLNFAWSLGAMAAPVLLLPFLHGANLGLLFILFQALFLLLFLWVLFRERGKTSLPRTLAETQSQPRPSLKFLLPMLVLIVCSVGIETALSGWLTTYSHRADPQSGGKWAFAVSFFMFGIVLSRLVFSTSLLKTVGGQRVLYATLWGTAFSVALLIAGRHIVAIDLAAGLCGLSIGPVYPLLLSFILERFSRGWIFAVAGIGSAVFPWGGGLLSAHFGSLRYGLIVPCVAALLMAALCSISYRSMNSFRLSPSSHL